MTLESTVELVLWTTTAAVTSAVAVTFAIPTSRSWIRRLSKRAGQEAAALEGRLEQMHDRMAELEERLDFAERLLTQHREREQLPDRATSEAE